MADTISSNVDPGSLRGALLRRHSAQTEERTYWLNAWMDLNNYLLPRTARFFQTKKNKPDIRNHYINDGSPAMAVRTLSAGMMSGVTNPTRPWVAFHAVDPAINDLHHVQTYLEDVRDRVLEVFLKSNLYTILPTVYTDLGVYGTSSFEVIEDHLSKIRFYHWPIGSYTLGMGERLTVDTAFRDTMLTIHQIAERFDYDVLPLRVKSMLKNKNIDGNYNVYHAIFPNDQFDPKLYEAKHKRVRSVWWMEGMEADEWLSDSGFDTMPLIAPRWAVIGEDSYGVGPGFDALGDSKALQLLQKRKMTVYEKYVNPPLQAPSALRTPGAITNLPGGITYTDTPNVEVKAMYQTNLQGMQYLLQDIQETKARIDTAFFKDLFLMISQMEREGVTATEIAAKQEEKLLALGPVYLRINDEMLDPLMERSVDILTRLSMPFWTGMVNGDPPLPKPPPELMGQTLSFEYISTMAQAMKAVGVTGIERSMTFAGSMAQAFPGVLDNIDSDKMIRRYFGMAGAPPDLLVDEEKRDQVRNQKLKQQAMQQKLAAANSAADTAQKLGNAPMDDNNALSQLVGRIRGAQPGGAPSPMTPGAQQ